MRSGAASLRRAKRVEEIVGRPVFLDDQHDMFKAGRMSACRSAPENRQSRSGSKTQAHFSS
jgi:hypothetical protein